MSKPITDYPALAFKPDTLVTYESPAGFEHSVKYLGYVADTLTGDYQAVIRWDNDPKAKLVHPSRITRKGV